MLILTVSLKKEYGMKHLKFLYNIACIMLIFSLSANTKHEIEIFGKWLAWQQLYKDRSFVDLQKRDDDNFLTTFRCVYQKNAPQLQGLIPLLSDITEQQISTTSYCLKPPLNQKMRITFSTLYNYFESNLPAFFNYLQEKIILAPFINEQEQQMHYDNTIEKYKAFSRLLVAQDDEFKENEYLIALANRFFEYAYDKETFPHYRHILATNSAHPVARFLNVVMWHNLVGDGWKHWHEQTLKHIKNNADQGKEIIYIAGGNDFYQLLRYGIYNITIIDPFFPTQERYYAEGWRYLIDESSIGEEVRFGPACESIKIKCTSYESGENFYAKLSNKQVATLKKATITWLIYDRDNTQIGKITIIRRPIEQQDLIYNEQKTFVVSYDELTYLAMPDILNGWNIDPTLLSDSILFYVKQLRKPVTKQTLINIRIASLLNLADLRFINFASDAT